MAEIGQLKSLVQNILQGNPIGMDDYLKGYNLCYQISTAGRGGSGDQNGGPSIPSLDKFLDTIHIFFQELVHKLQSQEDRSAFLELYANGWENVTFSAKVLNGILHYVVRQSSAVATIGLVPADTQSVFYKVLCLWSETVLQKISQKLFDRMVEVFDGERLDLGGRVKGTILKTILDSFTVLDNLPKGNGLEGPGQRPLTYYKNFELCFLEGLEGFYIPRRDGYISGPSYTITSYVQEVHKWMSFEEGVICHNYLRPCTKPKVRQILIRILVGSRLLELSTEFNHLLTLSLDDESEVTFGKIKSIHDLTCQLAQPVGLAQSYTKEILDRARGRMEGIMDQVPKNFQLPMDILIEVQTKFGRMTHAVFQDDPVLYNAFIIAMSTFVNQNPFTSQFGPIAKYSAKCFDLTLQNKEKLNEDEVEKKLDLLMTIFKYLKDKDVFLSFYTHGLASRLLRGTSGLDEIEERMITKLQQFHGFEFTSKMGRMYADIQGSKTLKVGFNQFLQSQPLPLPFQFDLNVRVLTCGSWPFSSVQNHQIQYPPELAQGRATFTTFYAAKHSGRKLTWVPGRENGEVTTNCFSKSHILVLSTFQMTIIDLYNVHDTLTLAQLLEMTGIEPKIFEQVIGPLVKIGLLECPSSSSDEDKIYSLNLNFSHKSRWLNLDRPLKMVTGENVRTPAKAIELDRKSFLEAAVMRVMKYRRKLSHQELVAATIELARGRFSPGVSAIKKVIDSLVDRLYLAPDITEANCYLYVL